MAQPSELSGGGQVLSPEEELALQQQQQKSNMMNGLMTPSNYADALFDPEGSQAPDTSMYAAPIEAQYQPGGAQYEAPYAQGQQYGMGVPASDPAAVYAQNQPTDPYNTAPQNPYTALTVQEYYPASGNSPTQNTYQSIDHMRSARPYGPSTTGRGYAAGGEPTGPDFGSSWMAQGGASGMQAAADANEASINARYNFGAAEPYGRGGALPLGFQGPASASTYNDAIGRPFGSGRDAGQRFAPDPVDPTQPTNPYATDRSMVQRRLADLYRSTEQQPPVGMLGPATAQQPGVTNPEPAASQRLTDMYSDDYVPPPMETWVDVPPGIEDSFLSHFIPGIAPPEGAVSLDAGFIAGPIGGMGAADDFLARYGDEVAAGRAAAATRSVAGAVPETTPPISARRRITPGTAPGSGSVPPRDFRQFTQQPGRTAWGAVDGDFGRVRTGPISGPGTMPEAPPTRSGSFGGGTIEDRLAAAGQRGYDAVTGTTLGQRIGGSLPGAGQRTIWGSRRGTTTSGTNVVGGANVPARPDLARFGKSMAGVGLAGALGGVVIDRSGLGDPTTGAGNPYRGPFAVRRASAGASEPVASSSTATIQSPYDAAPIDVVKLGINDKGEIGHIPGNLSGDEWDADRDEGFMHVLMTGAIAQEMANTHEVPLEFLEQFVGKMVAVPEEWMTPGIEVASVNETPAAAATQPAATDSGSSGGSGREWVDYGNSYRSRSYGGSSYGGGGGWGYGGGGGGGSFFPDGFGTGGGMFPGEDFGSDGSDPFADMMDNPLFARYFEVLSRSMGPDRARMFMRKFGSRFKGMDRGFRSMGKRSKTTRTKGRRPSLSSESASAERSMPADNAAIQESVRKDVAKQTGTKRKKDE